MIASFLRPAVLVLAVAVSPAASAADPTLLTYAAPGFILAAVALVGWLVANGRLRTSQDQHNDMSTRLAASEKTVAQLQAIRAELTENLNMAKAESVANDQRRREVSNMLAALRAQVEKVARVDGLTGVANRQQFDISLTDEIKRCVREHKDISLLLVEVDSFVDFRDISGEEKSEFALQRIASSISESFRRAGDLVARIGEFKFAVLLPGANNDTAARFAEKMRKSIYAEAIPFPQSEIADRITVSVGLASLPPVRLHKPQIAIGIAENALREAQNNGHNQVASGDESVMHAV